MFTTVHKVRTIGAVIAVVAAALASAGVASAAIVMPQLGTVTTSVAAPPTAVADTNTGSGSGSGGQPYPGDGFCEGMYTAAHVADSLGDSQQAAGLTNAAVASYTFADNLRAAAWNAGCPSGPTPS
jgi:hypothetical protein